MVRKILSLFSTEIRGLHEAAYLLGAFAFLSQLLALVRDRIFAHTFGAGTTLDVYYAAFRIPDLIFVIVASTVSVYVLIPILSERLNVSIEEGRKFVSDLFSSFLIIVLAVCAIAFIWMPYLVSLFFPGLVQAGHGHDLTLLGRVLLVQPIFLGISNLFASVIQVYRRFLVYALSPLLYNAGIIVGAVFFYPMWGIQGLAWGVVCGAVLHAAVQIPFLIKERFMPQFTFAPPLATLSRVAALSIPRSLSLSASNLTLLIFAGMASLMPAGSIAVFTFAFNLQSVPLTIIGMSYSVAAFPLLAALFAKGERAEFAREVYIALRHIAFWSLPAIALFIVLRAQVVRVILGSGAFTWDDTRLTAAALALFALSLFSQAALLLISRAYYAAGQTRIPLYANGASAALAVLFAFIFSHLFVALPVTRYFLESILRVSGISGTEILMLPLGYSLGVIIASCWLVWRFRRDFDVISVGNRLAFWRSGAAAILAGAAAYMALNAFALHFDLDTFTGIFAQGFLAGSIGIGTGILTLWLLGSAELTEVWDSFHKRFWKARAIAPGQEGV